MGIMRKLYFWEREVGGEKDKKRERERLYKTVGMKLLFKMSFIRSEDLTITCRCEQVLKWENIRRDTKSS